MLGKILLGLSALSNLATLAGLWIAVISAPTSVQPRIAQVLLIAGAVCSIVLYLSFFWFVLQPRTSQPNAKHEKKWGAFRDPRWQLVRDHKFINESVDIDGKGFINCSFTNVRLFFHGTAPAEFREGCEFGDSLVIATDNPVAMFYTGLQKTFSSIPGARIEVVATDDKGRSLPYKFKIREIASPTDERP